MTKQLVVAPASYLQTGQAVSISLPEPGIDLAAVVIKVASDQIWLQLARTDSQASFQKRELIRVKYADDVAVYYFDTKILEVWGSDQRNLAVSTPAVGVILERRIAFRISEPLPFSFTVIYAAEGELIGEKVLSATTTDLSVGGLKFESELAFSVGDQLDINLHLPLATTVNAVGWVVRSEENAVGGTGPRKIALRFLHLKADEQKSLLKFLGHARSGRGR